jgi:hypothetical protein
MYRLFGLVLAGALLLGHASVANAQFSPAVGYPFTGGFAVGSPYGYPAAPYYGRGFMAPGTTVYNSGYVGYAAPGAVGYPAYAVPRFGGYRAGFRPFLGPRRPYRWSWRRPWW